MSAARPGLVIWDIDGTLIPADLRWLRRAIARTYALPEPDVVFPAARVHGFTDESIVVETAVASGISQNVAEDGVSRFHGELTSVMSEGEEELARDQPAYVGAAESIAELDEHGLAQTVLTGNMRYAAEMKHGNQAVVCLSENPATLFEFADLVVRACEVDLCCEPHIPVPA